jgi:hypothetical protein
MLRQLTLRDQRIRGGSMLRQLTLRDQRIRGGSMLRQLTLRVRQQPTIIHLIK